MKYRLVVLFIPVLIFIYGCLESFHASGTTSSETTNGITISGKVLNSDGSPVAYQMTVLSKTTQENLLYERVDTTKTDSNGAYRFEDVTTGTYYVSGEKDSLTLLSQPVVVNESVEEVRLRDTLSPAGRLSGELVSPLEHPVYLRLSPGPYLFPLVPGPFAIPGLKPGRYECMVFHLSDSGIGGVLLQDSVTIQQAGEAKLGSVRLTRFGPEGDTVLLDDFEDGDQLHIGGNAWRPVPAEPAMSITPDSTVLKSILPHAPGADGSKFCLRSEFVVDTSFYSRFGYHPMVGYHVSFGLWDYHRMLYSIHDFSKLEKIEFKARGSADRVQISLRSGFDQKSIQWGQTTSLTTEWRGYSLSGPLLQDWEKWDAYKNRLSLFLFHILPRQDEPSGWLELDDVKFVFSP